MSLKLLEAEGSCLYCLKGIEAFQENYHPRNSGKGYLSVLQQTLHIEQPSYMFKQICFSQYILIIQYNQFIF